jgi:hypothetical protein
MEASRIAFSQPLSEEYLVPSIIVSTPEGSDRPLADPCALHAQPPSLRSFTNPSVFRILSVGGMDGVAILGEALKRSRRFSLTHAGNYRDLWRLSRGCSYDAVVFDDAVSRFELEEAAHLVRHGWPSAKILLIRSGEITLADPLYDLRLRPPVDSKTLLSVLSGQARPARQKPRPHLRMAHAMGS